MGLLHHYLIALCCQVFFCPFYKSSFLYGNIRAALDSDETQQDSTHKIKCILHLCGYFAHYMLYSYKSVYDMCIDSRAGTAYSLCKDISRVHPV